MSEPIAWAAGFFDGEGSVRIMKAEHKTGYRRLCISIAQVDRRPLDYFRNTFGVGTVRGPYGPYFGNRQPYFQYMVHGAEAVLVGQKMLPFLLGKAEQVNSALTAYIPSALGASRQEQT